MRTATIVMLFLFYQADIETRRPLRRFMFIHSKKKIKLLIINFTLIISVTTSMLFSFCIDQNRDTHWKLKFRDNCIGCQTHATDSYRLPERNGITSACLDIPFVIASKVPEDDRFYQEPSFSTNKAKNNAVSISASTLEFCKKAESDNLFSSFFQPSVLRSVILLV